MLFPVRSLMVKYTRNTFEFHHGLSYNINIYIPNCKIIIDIDYNPIKPIGNVFLHFKLYISTYSYYKTC
jgi:hypothetical protein